MPPLARSAKGFSTAVWLDRVAAIDGARASGGALGLVEHLDAGAGPSNAPSSGSGALLPLNLTIVVYNLPRPRLRAARASNGELQSASNGLQTYRTQYIDRIAEILGRSAYAGLRITAVIEPDSFPNMITNLSVPACAAVNQGKIYEQGIQYALRRLSALPNVYLYLDNRAPSGWLGWDNNRASAVRCRRSRHWWPAPTPQRRFVDHSRLCHQHRELHPGQGALLRGHRCQRALRRQHRVLRMEPRDRRAGLHRPAAHRVHGRRLPGRPGLHHRHQPQTAGEVAARAPAAAAADVDDMRIEPAPATGPLVQMCATPASASVRAPAPMPRAATSTPSSSSSRPAIPTAPATAVPPTPNAEGKRFDPNCGTSNADALQGAPTRRTMVP